MADIELMIKISKEKYDVIKSDLYNTFPAEMKEWGLEAIRNSIPLPKGHGRLIDADVLRKKLYRYTEAPYQYALTIFNESPIIIEADTESEE